MGNSYEHNIFALGTANAVNLGEDCTAIVHEETQNMFKKVNTDFVTTLFYNADSFKANITQPERILSDILQGRSTNNIERVNELLTAHSENTDSALTLIPTNPETTFEIKGKYNGRVFLEDNHNDLYTVDLEQILERTLFLKVCSKSAQLMDHESCGLNFKPLERYCDRLPLVDTPFLTFDYVVQSEKPSVVTKFEDLIETIGLKNARTGENAAVDWMTLIGALLTPVKLMDRYAFTLLCESTGIGKTSILHTVLRLCRKTFKTLGGGMGYANQFSTAQLITKPDCIILDDIDPKNEQAFIAQISNLVSNNSIQVECKGQDIITVGDYRARVCFTANRPLFARRDFNGFNANKLITLALTRARISRKEYEPLVSDFVQNDLTVNVIEFASWCVDLWCANRKEFLSRNLGVYEDTDHIVSILAARTNLNLDSKVEEIDHLAEIFDNPRGFDAEQAYRDYICVLKYIQNKVGEENYQAFSHSLNISWEGLSPINRGKQRHLNLAIKGNEKAIQVLKDLQARLEDFGFIHNAPKPKCVW